MVELRAATPADAHDLAVVHVESWRAAYRGLIPDEVLAGLSVSERERTWSARLAATEPRTSVVVAIDEHRVVGFAATGPPSAPTDHLDSMLGDLYALYLDPGHWGRGIGAPLHAAALHCLVTHGFTHAGLWILDGNERAERFYHRHGWIDTGRTQIDRRLEGVELYERRMQRSLATLPSRRP